MKYTKPWEQGTLRVAGNSRYLRNGDTPFFYLGDTAWLLCPVCDEAQARLYLTNRRDKGFTVIQAVLIHRLPQMPATNPAEVEKDATDPAYWAFVDRVVDIAGELGLYMALLPAWGSVVQSGLLNRDNIDRYVTFLAGRFGHRPNIIWLLGGDIRGDRNKALYAQAGQLFKRLNDLVNWDGPFVCFENDGTFWADRNYWAPEVHPWQGRFYMFASFKNAQLCRGTAILVADMPMGPFRSHSDGRVTPPDWECLDGTFYVSRAGKPYMVFCHEWVQAGDGEVCAMALEDDLSGAAGEPWVLFHASDAPWCKVMHHSSGVDGCVTDGPFLWRTADGTLECLWASFSKDGYTQGVAVSDNGDIDGHFVQAEPLFREDGGHGMVFRALDGQLYLTLNHPNKHLAERPCFHPLREENGRLVRRRTLPA